MTTIEDIRLPAALVQKRYGVSQMTLWRWLRRDELQFPQPIVINGRRYWALSELAAWDAQQKKTEVA